MEEDLSFHVSLPNPSPSLVLFCHTAFIEWCGGWTGTERDWAITMNTLLVVYVNCNKNILTQKQNKKMERDSKSR